MLRLDNRIMKSPYVVNVSRLKKRGYPNQKRSSIRQIAQDYLARERLWEFVVELTLFGVLAIVSAWPMIHAVEVLRRF